ncbi:hypothetical protein [Nocardia mexicana]|nr:hypothetical protein [Nocardia mexicana]
MRRGARAVLVAVAAGGVLGGMAMPIAAGAPTTGSVPPTGQVGSCPTTMSAVGETGGETCPEPDPVLSVPPSVERGTDVEVSGDYWPCVTIQVSASWSGAVLSANVDGGSFTRSVPVDDQVEPGSYSVSAACSGYSASRSIKIVAPFVSTTEPTTTKPKPTTDRVTTPPTVSETTGGQPSLAAQSDGEPKRDNKIGTVLAIIAFLLAVVVATLVLRRRKRAPDATRAEHHDPGPQRVRVRVVADTSPSIQVRELTRPTGPVVRIRVHTGEPRIRVREIPR